MVTSRTVLAGSCLALAMLTAAGCAQVNEVISGRDLECTEVPEDICVRLADDIVSQWPPQLAAEAGPIVTFNVRPVDCGFVGRQDQVIARCWEGNGTAADLADGQGAAITGYYFQTNDGRIFSDTGRVVGN